MSVLPPYFYQMMDHLYISDTRGYATASYFDLVINTSYLLKPCLLRKSVINDHTQQITMEPSPTGTLQIHEVCSEITAATMQYQKILLYGDDYSLSALLVYTYLTTRYHFTNIDIERLISTRPFNPGLTTAFQQLLSKNEGMVDQTIPPHGV